MDKLTTQNLSNTSESLILRNVNNGMIKSLDQARKAKVPTLAAMTRDQRDGQLIGKEEVTRMIAKWLIELNKLMNLKKPMSNAEIIMCSQMIMEDYYYLKSTDLAFFFTGIIKGERGEMYESLSITKIMSWLSQYSDERMNISSQEAQMKHDKIVSKESNTPRVAK